MVICALYTHDGAKTASAEFNTSKAVKAFIKKELKIDLNSTQLVDTYISPKHRDKYDKEVRDLIRSMSKRLEVEEEWFYQLLEKESGGNPQSVNKQEGDSNDPIRRIREKGRATGLIQFMPPAAKGVNTTQETLYYMTVSEQLVFVEKYLLKWKKNRTYDSFLDLYLAVFYPWAIDKEHSTVLGTEVSDKRAKEVRRQNKGIDKAGNNNGYIEKSDIAAWLS